MKDTYIQIVELINGMIEHRKDSILLSDLEKLVGLSPAYVQKLFMRWVGVCPQRFGTYITATHARTLLQEGLVQKMATNTIGRSGAGCVHNLFLHIEAMTATERQQCGKNLTLFYCCADTPFGKCIIVTTAKGVCAIFFGDTDEVLLADLSTCWSQAVLIPRKTSVHSTVIQYLRGGTPSEKIVLHVSGTHFQIKVWEALLSIPQGAVTSYGAIASAINNASAVRAVGTAIGNNPIGYMIPCHRVLQATGQIGGYRWGTERKRVMLEYEALREGVH